MKKVYLAATVIGTAAWLVTRKQGRIRLTPSWSTRQRMRGALTLVRGIAKRKAGHLRHDPALIVHGLTDQAVGAVRYGAGKAVAPFGL